MASRQDFWEFFDDFFGAAGTFPTSADGLQPWTVTDTSSAGTPTYTRGSDASTGSSAPGVAKLDLAADDEVENVCLMFAGIEQLDVNDGLIFETRLKMNQAAIGANTTFSFGLASGRNATWESTTTFAAFQLLGSASTTVLYCETDDGTNDVAPVSTGLTLINAYKTLKIDMQNLDDVKFYMTDGNSKLVRVCGSTTFDMGAFSGSVFPIFQLQKASGAATDGVTIDYVRVTGRRKT
jgi:hypothetical protein